MSEIPPNKSFYAFNAIFHNNNTTLRVYTTISLVLLFLLRYVGGESRRRGARVTDIAIAFPVAPSDWYAAIVAKAILGAGSLTRSAAKLGNGTAGRLNQVRMSAGGQVRQDSFAE